MTLLDPQWTPLAGYSHATAILAALQAHDDAKFGDGRERVGVDSDTPPSPQGGTSRRKEDANQ